MSAPSATNPTAGGIYPPGSFASWAPAPTHNTPHSFQLPPLRDALANQENTFYGPPFTQAPAISSYHHHTNKGIPTSAYPLPLQPTQSLLPATPLTDASQNLPPTHRRSSAKPVAKVAGTRRPVLDIKGKGKASNTTLNRPAAVANLDVTPAVTKKARGRVSGAANYNDEDLEALMDVVEDILPVGKKGWNTVGVQFAEWARENRRPERTADALEKKFKLVLQIEKPTGQADCPSWLDRAHAIDRLMEEKVTTRNLDDEDIADGPIELTDDELDQEFTWELLNRKPASATKAPAPKIKKEPTSPPLTVSRRAQTATLTRVAPRNGAGNEFLKSISKALDPSARAAISDERATRSILQTQILTLTIQLRDEKTNNEILRNRVSNLEQGRNDLLRQIDRLEMLQAIQDASSCRNTRTPHTSRTLRTPRTPVQYKKRRRQDIVYADGLATMWVGSDESDHRRDSPTTRRYTHDDSPTPGKVAQPSPEKIASTSAVTL